MGAKGERTRGRQRTRGVPRRHPAVSPSSLAPLALRSGVSSFRTTYRESTYAHLALLLDQSTALHHVGFSVSGGARRRYLLSSEMLPSRREGCLGERATPRAHRRTAHTTHTRTITRKTHTEREPRHRASAHTTPPSLRDSVTLFYEARRAKPICVSGTADDDRSPRAWSRSEETALDRRAWITARRHCSRGQRGEDRRRLVVPSSSSSAPRPSAFNDASLVGEHYLSGHSGETLRLLRGIKVRAFDD